MLGLLTAGAPTLSCWMDAALHNSVWNLAASELGLDTSTIMALDGTSPCSGFCNNLIGESVTAPRQAGTRSPRAVSSGLGFATQEEWLPQKSQC